MKEYRLESWYHEDNLEKTLNELAAKGFRIHTIDFSKKVCLLERDIESSHQGVAAVR